MALRPEIRGFSLAMMRKHFGSQDAAAFQAIAAKLDEGLQRDPHSSDAKKATYRESVLGTVHQAIFEGVPIAGLEVERDPQVHAAILLAHHGQTVFDTGSNTWNMEPFYNMVSQDHRWISIFLRGRALLGRKIETNWSNYGYFAAGEFGELRGEIAPVLSFLKERQDEEADFWKQLEGWLAALQGRGQDLFFWTA